MRNAVAALCVCVCVCVPNMYHSAVRYVKMFAADTNMKAAEKIKMDQQQVRLSEPTRSVSWCHRLDTLQQSLKEQKSETVNEAYAGSKPLRSRKTWRQGAEWWPSYESHSCDGMMGPRPLRILHKRKKEDSWLVRSREETGMPAGLNGPVPPRAADALPRDQPVLSARSHSFQNSMDADQGCPRPKGCFPLQALRRRKWKTEGRRKWGPRPLNWDGTVYGCEQQRPKGSGNVAAALRWPSTSEARGVVPCKVTRSQMPQDTVPVMSAQRTHGPSAQVATRPAHSPARRLCLPGLQHLSSASRKPARRCRDGAGRGCVSCLR